MLAQTSFLLIALSGCAALVDGGTTPPDGDDGPPGGIAPDSLRAHTSDELRWIGAAAVSGPLADDPEYGKVLAREYNSITTENALMWAWTEALPNEFTFGAADAVLGAAKTNAQAVHGHTLVSHVDVPAWFDEAADPVAAFERHITTVASHYAGKIRVWDVVSDAVSDDGGLRDTVFLRRLGPGYIARAFELAHAADPGALLAYEDYGAGAGGPKADAVYQLVAKLVADGAPITAVALDYHVTAYELAAGYVTETAIRAQIQRYAALGLRVLMSGVDVRLADLDASVPDRMDYQRRIYHLLGTICRTEPACDELATWGFTDRYSWIDMAFGVDDPLPFDEAFGRKPGYDGLRAALDGTAPETMDLGWDTSCKTLTGALLCDPLESSAHGGLWFSTRSGGFAGATSPVHRGKLAYQFTTSTGPESQAQVGRRVLGDVTSGRYYSRAWVYVPTSATVDNIALMNFAEAHPPYGSISLNVLASGALMMSATTAAKYDTLTATLPRDRWTCLQLEITVGQSGGAAVWIDGVEKYRATSFDTLPAGGIGTATFGILWLPAGAAATQVYFDEIAVDDAPIPCT